MDIRVTHDNIKRDKQRRTCETIARIKHQLCSPRLSVLPHRTIGLPLKLFLRNFIPEIFVLKICIKIDVFKYGTKVTDK
jgi:hypothetical protein